jgi:hypothetical protein
VPGRALSKGPKSSGEFLRAAAHARNPSIEEGSGANGKEGFGFQLGLGRVPIHAEDGQRRQPGGGGGGAGFDEEVGNKRYTQP